MENNVNSTDSAQETKPNIAAEVKEFYKEDFKNIFFTFFKNPINGIYSILQRPSEKSYIHSLILYGSVFVLYFIGLPLLAGDMKEFLELSHFLKFSLIPVILMFVISCLSFGVKSISGNPTFKNELLTGGLSGIPLGMIIPIMLIFKIFGSEEMFEKLMRSPEKLGIFVSLFFFYIILMLINIFQQSLRSAKTNMTLTWYMPPVAILLAFYITYILSESLLF